MTKKEAKEAISYYGKRVEWFENGINLGDMIDLLYNIKGFSLPETELIIAALALAGIKYKQSGEKK